MSRALIAVVVLIVLGLAFFWLVQRRMIYQPFGDVPSRAEAGVSTAELVTLRTDDGLVLNAWFVPVGGSPEGAVVVFNGNAGNRGYRADIARQMLRLGYSVLLFDYRGYGDNPGAPTEDGLARDARAARRFLDTRPGVDRNRIVYFGESLGAAVAVGLALEQAPRALILRSPFTSLAEVARYHFPYLPVSLLLRDRFPSLDRIAKVRCPVLVIAGDHDTIVPTDQSRRLFDAASQPKQLLIVEHTDHNDEELIAGDRMMSAVGVFLRGTLP